MIDNPQISVIIPVYNGERWIEEQLHALIASDFDEPWEIIVADNGSTDRTRHVAEGVAMASGVSIRVVDAGQKPGAAHARNVGAIAARSPILAFCDADDHVSKSWVGAAARSVRSVGPGVVRCGLNRRLGPNLDDSAPVVFRVVDSQPPPAFVSSNFALKASDFHRCRGFDSSFAGYGCEDSDFAVRARKSGLRLEGCEQMVVFFRETDSKRTLVKKVYMSSKAEVLLWHRHPDVYVRRTGIPTALVELGLAPRDVAKALRSNKRQAVRILITRWGHFIAEFEHRFGKPHPEPQLLDE